MPRYQEMAPRITVDGQTFRPGLVTYEFSYEGEEYYHQVQPGERGRLDLVSQRFTEQSTYSGSSRRTIKSKTRCLSHPAIYCVSR